MDQEQVLIPALLSMKIIKVTKHVNRLGARSQYFKQ